MVFIALITGGCGGRIKETVVTTTFYPTKAATIWDNSPEHLDRVLCNLSTGKIGNLAAAPPGTVLVGFDNHYFTYDRVLFTCWEKNDYVYRGQVLFDVSSLVAIKSKLIDAAQLKWSEDATLRAEDGDRIRGGDTLTCSTRILLASTAPSSKRGLPPGALDGFVTVPKWAPESTYDARQLLKDWMAGPNHGAVFTGSDESYPKNNGSCLAVLGKFRLWVRYIMLG